MSDSSVHPAAAAPACRPRLVGRVNWYGAWTLYLMEVWRFLKMPMYTVLAPMVTSLLFLTVFALGLGSFVRPIGGVPMVEFIAPGLVMMAIVGASFENPSSSLVMGKLHGSIADVLTPPLGPGEFTLGYVLGGATRGVVTGAALLVAMQPFVTIVPSRPGFVLLYAVSAGLALSMLGLITGLWAAKWDHLALVSNFTIVPLTFLSGAFYSIERLPDAWRVVSQFNPIFYMIDGFRYGFIGAADGSLATGLAVMAGLNLALWFACRGLVARGYNLKS